MRGLVGRSARAKLDDLVVKLKRWDAVRVPPRRVRSLRRLPKGPRSSRSARRTPGLLWQPTQNRCRTGGPIETARVRFGRLEVTNSAGGGCLSPGRW
jgi:hypothetical protein